MMDSLFGQWSAVLIGIGSLISLWFWSIRRDWCLQQWKFWCHAALMDGPPALPIIGNAHYFAGSVDDLLKKLLALTKLYRSPIRFWLGTKLMVGITNPRDIQIVMNSSKATYKAEEYRFVEAFLGRGLITTLGPTHKKHRSLIMPMVNGKALNAYVDSFDIHSRRCVECLNKMVGEGEFDILPFMDMCLIDVTFDSIIGAPATAHQNGHTELVKCLHKLHQLSYERCFKIWLYSDWIYYRTERGKQHKKAETICQKFMDDAQDPSAYISSFTLLMLAMHPEIQEKVRMEGQQVVGDRDLTARTMSELKYLDLVIKETVRLFPIGTILLREVQKDLEFDTCSAPKGCTIAMFVFGIHRDPKFWYKPEKFNPDRFLPDNFTGRHPFAYIPFSGGVRGCIGQQYAKMMIKALVTSPSKIPIT